jgi:ribosomal protein S18 acetylase RimI-like enzyme
VTIAIEELAEVTDEVVEALARLLPQLSTSAQPLDAAAIQAMLASPAVTVLIARSDDKIVGTLSLVVFRIPTGGRAWIEDVIVDNSVRGQGIGLLLTEEAVRLAKAAGARTVDLTTRPSRVAAGNLYEKVGFTQRDTRVYRHTFD